ncbi:hypothetical protein B566_EDAN012629 [Ephemera danica]|nr:hypothetical protein B566_EDAN012629 [Ephemera danica]
MIPQNETLYRGMVPVLESLCVSNFVYFYTFHGLKAVTAKPTQQNASRDLLLAAVAGTLISILLAAVAGVVNVFSTTPFWVVNTRLKMKGVRTQHAAAQVAEEDSVPFNGLLSGLAHIARTEGILALWQGTLPSLFLVSNPSLQFMAYESIKRRLLAGRPHPAELGSLAVFCVGAMAKAFATITTYPLQLVQTKLRHGHNYPNLKKNANMIELTVYIIRLSGVKGMFKGMEAKILQTILTAALMFVAYEKITAFVFQLMRMDRK